MRSYDDKQPNAAKNEEGCYAISHRDVVAVFPDAAK